MPRTYKIRRFTNGQSKGGKEFTNYSLTVPANIASQLPPDILFECALTEDGILFRPSLDGQEDQIELPTWATPEGEDDVQHEPDVIPAARSRKRAARQAA